MNGPFMPLLIKLAREAELFQRAKMSGAPETCASRHKPDRKSTRRGGSRRGPWSLMMRASNPVSCSNSFLGIGPHE